MIDETTRKKKLVGEKASFATFMFGEGERN